MVAKFLKGSTLPALSVVLGLLFGALLIIASGKNPLLAYSSMAQGAFFGADEIGRTLQKATPLILAGLAVAFAFKAGLFNIGGQGQLLIGATFAAWAGFQFQLPAVIHIPFALAIGGITAAVFGWMVGALKAYRGTHEVISTIMFNFIAMNITDWLASNGGPFNDPHGGAIARTPEIHESARIPEIGPIPMGFFVAVAAAVICWWIIEKTNFGFEIRTTGLNSHAARYAGINTRKILMSVMAISAALAGIGGAIETQGVVGRYEPGFNTGLGFNGITIALLARTNPLAVVPAALLIGAMDAGATLMQSEAKVATEIISVIQAFILFAIAAPSVVRWITRIKADAGDSQPNLSAGWGA